MRIGLLAKKVGMSRFYDSAGLNHPVTILEVDNCQIIGNTASLSSAAP